MQEEKAANEIRNAANHVAIALKAVGNEASVGMFYVQHHVRESTPTVLMMKKVLEEGKYHCQDSLVHNEGTIKILRNMQTDVMPRLMEVEETLRESELVLNRLREKALKSYLSSISWQTKSNVKSSHVPSSSNVNDKGPIIEKNES